MEIKVLQERINKKEAQVQKLENKIAKWEANKTSEKAFLKELGDWLEAYPDREEKWREEWLGKCNNEIRWASRDLEEAKATLEKYYNMLEVEKQKENSINELPELFNDLQKLLIEKWDEFDINYRDRLISEYKTLGYKEFYKKHSYACYDKMYESDEQIHENNVKASKEVILDLINRVSFITGEIKDYSQLRLNRDNNGWLILNGNVIGNKGTAKVESIYAGGYNIQRLHIRVLVNKVNA